MLSITFSSSPHPLPSISISLYTQIKNPNFFQSSTYSLISFHWILHSTTFSNHPSY